MTLSSFGLGTPVTSQTPTFIPWGFSPLSGSTAGIGPSTVHPQVVQGLQQIVQVVPQYLQHLQHLAYIQQQYLQQLQQIVQLIPVQLHQLTQPLQVPFQQTQQPFGQIGSGSAFPTGPWGTPQFLGAQPSYVM